MAFEIDGKTVVELSDLDALKAEVAAIKPYDDSGLVAQISSLSAQVANIKPAATPTVDDFLAALKALLLGTATPAPSPTGTPAPQPAPVPVADVNTYPLTLPAPDADNTQEAGAGPNRLDLYISSSPGTGILNDVVILINGKAVIAPKYEVKATVGMTKAGANHLVLHGPWVVNGALPTVQIKGVAPNGINQLWMMGCTCDFQDLVVNGVYDSRGGVSVNSPAVFVSNGMDLTVGPPVAVAPSTPGASSPPTSGDNSGTVPYTKPASIISGATINGVAATPSDLQTLFNAIPQGGHLILPAGEYTGSAVTPAYAVTIEGAGGAFASTKTLINCTGFRPYQDKAVIAIAGSGTVIKNLAVTGGRGLDVNGANGAGIRQIDAGIDFTLDGVESYGNEDGELAFAANTSHLNCHFHDNGLPANDSQVGFDHDVYDGGDAPNTSSTIVGGLFEKPLGGHTYKSRAATFKASGGAIFESGPDGAAIDYPDGGVMDLDGVTVRKLPGSPTLNMVTIGVESAKNASSGMVAKFNNVTWDDVAGTAILQGGNGASLIITGTCTYNGPNPPDIRGFSSVTGQFTKAE